jgi:signal transduction histidine kinase
MDPSRPEAAIAPAAGTPEAGAAFDSRSDSRSDHLRLDLRELLAGALQRLADSTDACVAAAWALDSRGVAFEAAALGERQPGPPDDATMRALWRLPGATDLTAPGLDPALSALAREQGFGAAAPLTVLDPEADATRPIAVLLLGFSQAAVGDPPTRVRPRALASLDQVVERLRAPATTAAAVSRLARLDDEVLRLTRLASIGDLLAEIVHEVRNPLVSVKTFLQLLPDSLDDPDFHTNFRRVVLEEVRRMERLLDSVLQQARPTPETAEEPRTALGPVLESVGRLLEKRGEQKDLRLTIDVGADLPDAAVAEDPLRQIVLNLALNAIEATTPGGRVRLSGVSGAAVSGAPAARGRPGDAASLEFIVDDEGPGVPDELRQRIFEPFFSTHSERPGGLGLAVCSRLAREAGGSIEVESSPHGGARFRVCLPAW